MSGRTGDNTIVLPLVGATVPANVKTIKVVVSYLGRTNTQTFTPSANLTETFVWDGKNSSGVFVNGVIPATATISQTYTDSTVDFPLTETFNIGTYNVGVEGLGNWGIDKNHFYDGQVLYFGNGSTRQITVSKKSGYVISSEDGSEVYTFDSTGRHLQTLNGLTGAALFTFSYDSSGRLSTMTDAYGKITTITRNSSGVPTGITSPRGQLTSLSINSSGNLVSITNPNNEKYTISYNTGALLHQFTKPAGQVSTMSYANGGYLSKDLSSAGSSTTLSYSSIGNPTIQTKSQLGFINTYTVHTTGSTTTRLQTDPSQETSQFYDAPDEFSSYSFNQFQFGQTKAADPRLTSSIYVSEELISGPGPTLDLLIKRTVSNLISPFNYGAISDVTTLNGNTSTSTFTLSSLSENSSSFVGCSPLLEEPCNSD